LETQPEIAFYKQHCAIYREIAHKLNERLRGTASTFEKLLDTLNASVDPLTLQNFQSVKLFLDKSLGEARQNIDDAESMDFFNYLISVVIPYTN
jgi:hypothetical protein